MTRTFVVGEVLAEIAGLREVARFPTLRAQTPGETLAHGFYFGLGHGVGLEVHESPDLALASDDRLVAGDVIAIEPGIEGWRASTASASRTSC
jgi:hypothetical protein